MAGLTFRYMMSHMKSLLEHVMETTSKGRKRERLIKVVEKKVADQAPLRIITCVMIASKLFSHKKVVYLNHILYMGSVHWWVDVWMTFLFSVFFLLFHTWYDVYTVL